MAKKIRKNTFYLIFSLLQFIKTILEVPHGHLKPLLFKERRLAYRRTAHCLAKMLVSQLCCHTSAWCSLDESFHNKIRFVNLFQRSCIFADSRCNGRNADRTSTKLVYNGQKYLVVYLVKTVFVDVQRLQRRLCDSVVDGSVAFYLCEIAYTTQQGIANTGRTARASGYLNGSITFNGHLQQVGRTLYNAAQSFGCIIL